MQRNWKIYLKNANGDNLLCDNQSLSDGLIGAAAALAFYGIGSYFRSSSLFDASTDLPTEAGVEDTVAHGAVGGFSSLAQGNSFGSGFLAAAVPQAATPYVGTALSYTHLQDNFVANGVAASVIGGTASELGGGKFANGAVTGAFGYLFNDALHHTVQQSSGNLSRSNNDSNGLAGSVKTGPNAGDFVLGFGSAGGLFGTSLVARYLTGVLSVEATEGVPFIVLLEGYSDLEFAALAVGAVPGALLGAGIGLTVYGGYSAYEYFRGTDLSNRNVDHNAESDAVRNPQAGLP